MACGSITFLLNNVQQIKNSQKKIIILEYHENNNTLDDIVLLLETHFSEKNENTI